MLELKNYAENSRVAMSGEAVGFAVAHAAEMDKSGPGQGKFPFAGLKGLQVDSFWLA